jgi:hypothetical protein
VEAVPPPTILVLTFSRASLLGYGLARSAVLSDDKPQLGPWLRRYDRQPETSPRERVQEILVAAGAAIGMLVVLVGVLLAFVRFPIPTAAILVAVWGGGYLVFLRLKRRSDAYERELRARLDEDDRHR